MIGTSTISGESTSLIGIYTRPNKARIVLIILIRNLIDAGYLRLVFSSYDRERDTLETKTCVIHVSKDEFWTICSMR